MTTPVGSIKLNLELDGSALPAELLLSIAEAMRPALEEMQRQLREVQREQAKTERAAAKSGAEQAASAQTAAHAVGELGDEYGKTAAKAQASERISTRSINAQTRAFERQTAAILANTAARTANASAPVGGPPPSGGGGGGGGGRGGGGSGAFGDLFTGQGGGSRFLTSPVGLNALALGAGALPAATTAVVNLVGAVQQLGQAGLLVPGVFATIGASVGTAVLGFHGVKDAVDALNKAAASGDPKDLKKATEALKDLDPAAVAVAKSVSQLVTGPLKDLQKQTAGNLLGGLDKTLEDTAARTLPTLQRGLGETSKALNGTFKELGRVVGLDSSQSFLDKVFGNTAEAQTRANAAIEPIVHAVGQLTAESSDFIPRLADGVGKLGTRLDAFITRSVGDGSLDRAIDQGIEGAGHLGDAMLNVLKILNDITKAAGGDGGFLKWLDDVTTKLEAFLSSTDGQERLTKFFTDGRAKLDEYLPVLRDIARIAVDVVQGFQRWGDIILPVVGGIAHTLAEMPGSLSVFVTGLLALKTTAGLAGLLTTLTGINTQLGGIGGRAGGSGGGGGLLGGGRNLFGGALTGLAAGAVGNELLSPTGPDGKPVDPSGLATLGGFAANIGGGALAGAQIGGPVGAAVGGLTGAVVSVFETVTNAVKAANARADKFLEDSNRNRPPDDPERPGSKEGQLAAFPALRGQQQPDVYFPDGTPRPKLGQQIADLAAKGALPPGYGIGPDGVVFGPNGPLPGLQFAPPTAGPPPPPPVLPPPVPTSQGVPFPVVPVAPQPVPSPNPLLPTVVPAPPAVQAATAANPVLAGPAAGNAIGQAQSQVQQLATDIQRLPEGEIKIKDPSPDVLANLGKVDAKITDLGNNEIKVKANTEQATAQIDALVRQYQRQQINLVVTASGGVGGVGAPPPPPPPPAGRATGGPIIGPGGPTADLVPFMGSNGEWVLTAREVDALGGYAGVQALTSRLRGFAGGGPLTPHLGTGALPGPVDTDGNPTDLLQKIVDLLSGKGPSGAPLQVLAQKAALGGLTPGQKLAGQLPGTTPGRVGPFGTPIKPRNPGYEMAAAAIQALGGDPEKFIGPDPAQYFSQQFDQMLGTGGAGGGRRAAGLPGLASTADVGGAAAALSAFARSGSVGDLSAVGLDANDSVVKAIAAARNKKKGGLSADAIADLVNQVLTGGGFTGTLDPSNTSLVSSLQSYREKLAKGGVGRGMALTSTDAAGMTTPLDASAASVIALAQQANGGQYAAASDLAGGLADCSGAVSDLVEELTQGSTNPGRLFTTHNEAQVLQSLGAVPGFIPGNLNIGVSPTHTAATLPNGVNFESGGSGGGVVYGGNAKGALDQQFTQRFSLPTGAGGAFTGGGLPGFGGGAGPVPVYIVGGPGGGPAGLGGLFAKPVADALAQSGGQVAADVAGDAIQAVADTPLPGLDPSTLKKPAASNDDLVAERNPLALASMAGFKVPDFTRQGGQSKAGIEDTGQSFDASGRVFSDTSALMDRTFTSLLEQQQAQFQQTLAVLNEVKQRLAEDALKPVVTTAVQDAFNGLKDSVLGQIGTQLGQAAAPPIADAVKSAAASQSSPGGVGGLVSQTGNVVGGAIGLAAGGGISGGIPGRDSVPAMLMPGEHVFTTADVARMGGQAGVYAFRSALARGHVQGFATGGGVIGNATVGADFFGVSQVPILSTIVNFLVQLLLKMIGLNIEVRDTLNEMSSEVRQFRGDFQKFDASGRLINDTSALLDRSSSSEQEVADERVRILKLVIQAIIKYIIEKVIVPIAKAVANAAISAVGSAAGAAVNTQAPGAGGIVSAVISSAGQAGVEIFAEIASDFAVSLSSVLVESIAEGLQDLFPDLIKGVFSGAGFEQLLAAPIGDALGGVLGGLAGMFLLGGLPFGGKGDAFDSGGLAFGTGMMPKATVAPERVLSPRETAAFERALGGGFGGNSSTTTIVDVGGIQMIGAKATPEAVRDGLLELVT